MTTTPTMPVKKSAAAVKKIAQQFQFTEGIAWHPDGFLLFSDLPVNKMYKLDPVVGKAEIFINDSGFIGSDSSQLSKMIGSNGIFIDHNRNIIFCQHGNHAIACLNRNNELKFLCCLFEGKPFNSPNDLTIKSDGTIYFTDPPYGLKDERLNEKQFQAHAGIYRLGKGKVELISKEMTHPNGICFSPDERFLYVSNSNEEHPYVMRYELHKDGHIIDQEVFIEALSDGLYCDPNGNLYLCGKNEIDIYAKNGELIDSIEMPSRPSNLCFGETVNEIFVSAGEGIYKIER